MLGASAQRWVRKRSLKPSLEEKRKQTPHQQRSVVSEGTVFHTFLAA